MQIVGVGAVGSGGPTTPVKPRKAAYVDPMDTNQDGVVSPAERLAYSLSHPLADAMKHLGSPQAVQDTDPSSFGPGGPGRPRGSRIDLYA